MTLVPPQTESGIKIKFDDGAAVSNWVRHLRQIDPRVAIDKDIVASLEKEGWLVYDVKLDKVEHDANLNFTVSRSTVSRALDAGKKPLVTLKSRAPGSAIDQFKHVITVQITRKESSLYHGTHGEKAVRLFLQHEDGKISQLLIQE